MWIAARIAPKNPGTTAPRCATHGSKCVCRAAIFRVAHISRVRPAMLVLIFQPQSGATQISFVRQASEVRRRQSRLRPRSRHAPRRNAGSEPFAGGLPSVTNDRPAAARLLKKRTGRRRQAGETATNPVKSGATDLFVCGQRLEPPAAHSAHIVLCPANVGAPLRRQSKICRENGSNGPMFRAPFAGTAMRVRISSRGRHDACQSLRRGPAADFFRIAITDRASRLLARKARH